VATDPAGWHMGCQATSREARAIYDQAIREHPDYPMDYYNLSCADTTEEKNLEAHSNIRKAFEPEGQC
jgi:hypothetical protein